MKALSIIPITVFVLTLTSCHQAQDPDTIVNTSYVHKYGVPIPKEEWASRGREGQVISTQKSGVVIQQTYVKGVLDGDTTYSYPHSSTIEMVETYSKGTLVKEVLNDENGTPRQMTEFATPSRKEITIWYDDGTPQSKESYEGDRLMSGQYLSRSNQVESTIENGYGKRLVKDKYGQLESTILFKDGQMTLVTILYPNGAPKEVVPYKDGLIDGELKTFLPGGEPEKVELWSKGLQDGTTTVYKNGERFADIPYSAGVKSGIEKHYRDGKVVVEEISWAADRRHGPSRSYVGETQITDWYWKGDQVSEAQFTIYSTLKPRAAVPSIDSAKG